MFFSVDDRISLKIQIEFPENLVCLYKDYNNTSSCLQGLQRNAFVFTETTTRPGCVYGVYNETGCGYKKLQRDRFVAAKVPQTSLAWSRR